MSNLLARSITAVVLGIFVLLLTWFGGMPFRLFVSAIGALILYEWVSITNKYWQNWQIICAACFYVLFSLVLFFNGSAGFVFLLIVVLAIVLALTTKNHKKWLFGGFVYACFPVSALSYLREYQIIGFGAIFFLYAVVWGTDIAAYFSGKTFGGAKLAPKFSPNKTWSGAVGGAVFGVLAGLVVAYYAFGGSFNVVALMILALFLSIVSQIGDICESFVKRQFSVKDSGSVLPGHGGIMDRVDGLIFASVLLYFISALLSDSIISIFMFHSL